MLEEPFEIEKGIPIPPRGIVILNTRYPFDKLEVGESFVFIGKPNTLAAKIGVARKALKPKEFTQRTIETRSAEEFKIRVWRTK